MSQGGSQMKCAHVWQMHCRSCGTDRHDWPELDRSLIERLEIAAQAAHASHLLSMEDTCREAAMLIMHMRERAAQATFHLGKAIHWIRE